MKCPNCGEYIKQGNFKCLRCGFEQKSLILHSVQDDEGEKENSNDENIKEIDPDKIRVGANRQGGNGSIFDDLFGGSSFSTIGGGLFGNIFGGFSNVIDEIFGGVFGSHIGMDEYDEDEEYLDEFGRPVQLDVFERDCIEINEVECYDEYGNLKETKNKKKKKEKSSFFDRKHRRPENDE